MGVLMTIAYILLFIVFLSILIVVHELGHFAMCKAFNVYVFEFSIGMGPALLKKKSKKGETTYSLRAIPFGGYVSMYDDDATLPEGVEIDPKRSMAQTKKWKRAIIMVAGVTMNVVLAFVMYFVSSWIPKKQFYVNYVENLPGQTTPIVYDAKQYGSSVFGIDEHAIVHFKDPSASDATVVAAMELSSFAFAKPEISNYLNFYYPVPQVVEDGDNMRTITTIQADKVVDISKVDYVDFRFDCLDVAATREAKNNGSDEIIYGNYKDIHLNALYDEEKQIYYYEDSGVRFTIETLRPKSLGDALSSTCAKFGNGATIVVQSLGTLITKPSTISQAGGIVAIGFESSKLLNNNGWSYYIELWAMISVNLAIINILPFPGLDGWHLLVLAVEAITKKTIPTKVKTIVAFVGIALLFGLMIFLVFKDVFKYIFNIGLVLLL